MSHFYVDTCTFDALFFAVFVAVADIVASWTTAAIDTECIDCIAVVVASSLGSPVFDIAPRIPRLPRSLKRFSVRDWIVRRSIHVFTDRDPTRAE